MRRNKARWMVIILLACWLAVWGGALAEEELPSMPISALVALEMEQFPTGGFAPKPFKDSGRFMSGPELDALYAAMGSYVAPAESPLVNRSDYFYYYEALDPNCRQIYDVLLQVAQDPVSPDNYGVLLTGLNPYDGTLARAYYDAYTAMTFDHPELFWLYNFCEADMRFFIEDEDYNGQYMVFFGMEAPFTRFEEQVTAFNQAADEFLADIDRTKSDYEIALQIHDKLAAMVTYDTENMNTFELIHTAYGALVANDAGTPHYAVCDGYSQAFEYLLQQCGIPALMLGGQAGNTPFDMGGHAWNMVRLDGVWYEVDITFEDTMVASLAEIGPEYEIYPIIHAALEDPDYRDRMDHHLFLISTPTMEHFEPDDSWLYQGLPLVMECYHSRLNDSPFISLGYDPRETVIALAPRAEHAFARP